MVVFTRSRIGIGISYKTILDSKLSDDRCQPNILGTDNKTVPFSKAGIKNFKSFNSKLPIHLHKDL